MAGGFGSNPFDDGSNPFDDPSVTAHTGGGGAPVASAPSAPSYGGGSFYDSAAYQQKGGVAMGATKLGAPPFSDGVTDEIPLGSSSKDVKKKERELKAKEEELRKKEQELKQRESVSGPPNTTKNWPACWPIVHHDIAGDIPSHLQKVQWLAFISFIGLVICLFWNAFSVLSAVVGNGLNVLNFIFAAIYLIAGTIGAWWLWYKRLYNAMRRDSALTFGFFFLMYIAHIFFCIWAAIAPLLGSYQSSFAGLLSLIGAMGNGNSVVKIFYLVGTLAWVTEAVLSIWVLRMVYGYFRSSGKGQEIKRDAAMAAARASV